MASCGCNSSSSTRRRRQPWRNAKSSSRAHAAGACGKTFLVNVKIGSRARAFAVPAPLRRLGRNHRSAIIPPFDELKQIDMEAERLNAIENTLADLRRRAGELRGYL
jgi:hypothetical protein